MPTVAEEAAAASPEKGSPVRTCHQLRGVLTRPIKEPLPGTFYPAVFGVFQSQPVLQLYVNRMFMNWAWIVTRAAAVSFIDGAGA